MSGGIGSTPEVRGWVARLGSYLRIFGKPAPGTLGYLTDARTGYLDHLIDRAKDREREFGGDDE